MTPQNLWVVWGETRPILVKSGWRERFYHVWILAAEGEEGLAQLRESMPNEFLAAMPLEALLRAECIPGLGPSKSFGPAWLRWPWRSDMCLVLSESGEFLWHERSARPEQGVVVLEGKKRDLRPVIHEGRRVLGEKDYRTILSDVRPAAEGHPRDWLGFMRDPVIVSQLRAFERDMIQDAERPGGESLDR